MVEREQVLITEEGYEGKYVALRSFLDRTVVASGDSPKMVMEQAHQKGCSEPVLFYVPEHNISLVYRHAY
jgi:hypothetical protein